MMSLWVPLSLSLCLFTYVFENKNSTLVPPSVIVNPPKREDVALRQEESESKAKLTKEQKKKV